MSAYFLFRRETAEGGFRGGMLMGKLNVQIEIELFFIYNPNEYINNMVKEKYLQIGGGTELYPSQCLRGNQALQRSMCHFFKMRLWDWD